MTLTVYSFYNNKGGVGKTTLCCNIAAQYAKIHPEKRVLVIDLCPQANASQFFLGGGVAGYEVNQKIQKTAGRKNIVGFLDWVLKGSSSASANPKGGYSVQVGKYNKNIPNNLYLIAGDSFLESLSLALNYAVINPVNRNAWRDHMIVIRRLCEQEHEQFKADFESTSVFIDCNPSFSIYTQMALVSSDHLIIPVMADYSSLEGIKGIFMLLYGEYPSEANKKYADDIITFPSQVEQFNLALPTIYEIIFNNYTANRGVATAYEALRGELISYAYQQFKLFPHLFAETQVNARERKDFVQNYISSIKDFHTAGKVSASLGIPIMSLSEKSKYKMPDGETVNLPSGNYALSVGELADLASRFQ